MSPAELMFNKRLWTHLDWLQPSIGQTVRQNQSRKKMDRDAHAKVHVFKEEDYVYIHSFDGKNKWLPGTITDKQGPLTFSHIDHIRSCECIDLPDGTEISFDDVVPTPI